MPKVAPLGRERRSLVTALRILDTPAEEVFDGLARLAALAADCPIAFISILDNHRHWFKTVVGMDVTEAPREFSLCEFTLEQNDIFVVPDATLDPRFKSYPIVTGKLGIRFYCGAPLSTGTGPPVGTICLLDKRPRVLTERQLQAVKDLQLQANSLLGLQMNRQLLKTATTSLRTVESQNQSLLDSITDIVYATDTSGIVTQCNAAGEWMLKYPAAELVGKHYLTFVHPEAKHRIRRFYDIQFARRIPNTRLEFPAMRADGSVLWVDQSVRLLLHDDQPMGFYCVARDVSERRARDRQLRESESRFRTMAENSPIGIYVTDEVGSRIYVNPAYLELSGYSFTETVGTLWSSHIHPADVESIREEWRRCADKGHPLKFTKRLLRKDKSHCWVHVVASAIRTDGVITGFVGTMEDVTLLKEAEDALKYANERLENRVQERTLELAHANETLRALTKHQESVREEERAHIAREIHDDLGQILSALKMEVASYKAVAESEGVKSPELDELSSSMTQLVETTIGTMRRIATELRPAILDTLGLVPALEWLCEDFARRTQVQCDFTTDLNTLQLSSEAATAIFRICQESLTNVMRHAYASRVIIDISRTDELFVLRIKDNGRGFERTGVAPPPGRPRLGLAGMRERAEILGGSLGIQSHPGKGTTVLLKVPIKNLMAGDK